MKAYARVEAPPTNAGAMQKNRARIARCAEDDAQIGIAYVVDGRSTVGDEVEIAFSPDDQFCQIIGGAA